MHRYRGPLTGKLGTSYLNMVVICNKTAVPFSPSALHLVCVCVAFSSLLVCWFNPANALQLAFGRGTLVFFSRVLFTLAAERWLHGVLIFFFGWYFFKGYRANTRTRSEHLSHRHLRTRLHVHAQAQNHALHTLTHSHLYTHKHVYTSTCTEMMEARSICFYFHGA